MFNPDLARLPEGITLEDLTGRRRTLALFDPPHGVQRIEDRWDEPGAQRNLQALWVGRTEMELR